VNRFTRVITSADAAERDLSLEELCRGATLAQLLDGCARLESFRRGAENLYERVRALFFLSALHRYHLPAAGLASGGAIPFSGFARLLDRRYEESIRIFLDAARAQGPNEAISSALAAAYRGFAFQTLADQVRLSVRSVRGNQWMFRCGHPSDYPLHLRPELLDAREGVFPILHEATPVRMDLTHSGWSDIFFLGMDFPEGARVLNVSIDLTVRGSGVPKPPVEAYLRTIDRPVLRLVSADLRVQTEVSTLAEVFDFARDYLGLLKAAVIASGLVPPGLEGAGAPLDAVLEKLTGRAGYGLELVSQVNDIPKGSRLAVSTSLLACLISVCMRATRQVRALTGGMEESDRRLVAARAILGEWLAGSGGGWQDSGGVWPGIKLIEGVTASEGDVEYGVSRGCLLPRHTILATGEVSAYTRERLQQSLVLVHGGMAQDVGPILEMVTEKYLLRSAEEWRARREAIGILDRIRECLRHGDIRGIGSWTQRNFDGPIQTIIPWAANHYTSRLIEGAKREFGDRFWGFWMLGGMAGGGMGFLFDPGAREEALDRMGALMQATKNELERGVPFAMTPVVYEFSINESGTRAALRQGSEALLPGRYYTLTVPELLRRETRSLSPIERAGLELFSSACRDQGLMAGVAPALLDHLLPQPADDASAGSHSLAHLLEENGFDRVQHEKIRADLRAGRIGLAQNRLGVSQRIENVRPGEILDGGTTSPERLRRLGADALAEGAVFVLSLAGGVGSRWTHGAGVVKALNPFCRMAGRHRTFVEIHLAKSRRTSRLFGVAPPHVFSTSYLTHAAFETYFRREAGCGYSGPLRLSPGRSVGLRLIPMVRDLRFAWEEMPHQALDVQKQKVLESLHASLIHWAQSMGEGSDYTDNLPEQCLHPVGHWYELPNLFRNGVLRALLEKQPRLRHVLLHNIDTLGADLEPVLLGRHIDSGAAMTVEVIPRLMDDRGGGLARVDGRLRLVEGLALPSEEIEFDLSYYNTGTMWIDLHRLLDLFGLSPADLADQEKVAGAVRGIACRMPAYVTLKDVKKRWGRGQEDVYPVTQFEKLWGDMTLLPELDCRFVAVKRQRGQQLKEIAQLDGWLRDGSAAYVESLCDWI
jgi:hypothetical protein